MASNVEEFEQIIAWADFCTIWRFNPINRKDLEYTEKMFKSQVNDGTSWRKIRNAARRCINGLPKGAYPKETGLQFIAGAWQRYPRVQPIVPAPPAPAGIVVPPRPKATDPAEVGFEEAFGPWPKNRDRPEKRDGALSAWRAATRRHGTEKMREATAAYIAVFTDPKSGMMHPMHFSNFVKDDELIEEFLLRGASRYTPEERAAFEAVQAWFPGTLDEKVMPFYLFHVKPEERFEFLVAVQTYRDVRRLEIKQGSMEKFTIGFPRFVAEWRTHFTAPAMADAVSRQLQADLRAAGADNEVDFWRGRFRDALVVLLRTRTPIDGMAELVRRVSPRLADRAVELAEKVLPAAYSAACVPPRTVLPSEACPSS